MRKGLGYYSQLLGAGGEIPPKHSNIPPPPQKKKKFCQLNLSWYSLYCENNNCAHLLLLQGLGGALAYSQVVYKLTASYDYCVYILGSFSAGQPTLTTQKSVCDTQSASNSLSEGSKLNNFLGSHTPRPPLEDYGLPVPTRPMPTITSQDQILDRALAISYRY